MDEAERQAQALNEADRHLSIGLAAYFNESWAWDDFIERLVEIATDNETIMLGMEA